MQDGILEKIVANKRHEVTLRLAYSKTEFSFYHKLKQDIEKNSIAIIGEVKKSSPSSGVIRENFDHVEIAKIYEKSCGISCISVLTDEKFFSGSLGNLGDIAKFTKKPLLQKDFIIDEAQIFEAKRLGATCILLIASILTLEEAVKFEKLAHNLDMDVLLEISNESELIYTKKLNTKLIGINNRNLKKMEIDKNNAINLAKLITKKDAIIISESGISNREDIDYIMKNSKIRAFLIGTFFMKQANIEKAVNELVKI